MEVKDERVDNLAEEGTLEKAQGAVEVRNITKLVGAEKERLKLESLLVKRAQFIGSTIGDELADTAAFTAESAIGGGGFVREKPKVVGFGKELAEMYGIGAKFDETAELNSENSRFASAVDSELIPATVRSRKGGVSGWKTADQLKEAKPEDLEKKAKTVNRSKLVYSGISA